MPAALWFLLERSCESAGSKYGNAWPKGSYPTNGNHGFESHTWFGAARPARKRSLKAALRDPNALRVLPLLDGGLLLRIIRDN
jgi:hypothetical protein